MPSISAMQPSPQSTKCHPNNTTKILKLIPGKIDKKVSVSKWRRQLRRGENKQRGERESPGAKLSLSISHRQAEKPPKEDYLPFVSPRKSIPQRSLVVSAYSSR